SLQGTRERAPVGVSPAVIVSVIASEAKQSPPNWGIASACLARLAMTPTAKEKNAGHQARRQFCRQSRRHLPEGNLLQRSLATWEDASSIRQQHAQYVGMRLALQRKASHDSHVSVARLYAGVMSRAAERA